MGAKTVGEAAQADNQFQAALKSLFAVAENYPDLKANQSFQQLQAELVDTEDKIQAARRFYNGAARDLNIKIQTFPTNIFAGMMGFKLREFFDVDANQQAEVAEPVKVDFSGATKK
jgi:LemA protein